MEDAFETSSLPINLEVIKSELASDFLRNNSNNDDSERAIKTIRNNRALISMRAGPLESRRKYELGYSKIHQERGLRYTLLVYVYIKRVRNV